MSAQPIEVQQSGVEREHNENGNRNRTRTERTQNENTHPPPFTLEANKSGEQDTTLDEIENESESERRGLAPKNKNQESRVAWKVPHVEREAQVAPRPRTAHFRLRFSLPLPILATLTYACPRFLSSALASTSTILSALSTLHSNPRRDATGPQPLPHHLAPRRPPMPTPTRFSGGQHTPIIRSPTTATAREGERERGRHHMARDALGCAEQTNAPMIQPATHNTKRNGSLGPNTQPSRGGNEEEEETKRHGKPRQCGRRKPRQGKEGRKEDGTRTHNLPCCKAPKFSIRFSRGLHTFNRCKPVPVGQDTGAAFEFRTVRPIKYEDSTDREGPVAQLSYKKGAAAAGWDPCIAGDCGFQRLVKRIMRPWRGTRTREPAPTHCASIAARLQCTKLWWVTTAETAKTASKHTNSKRDTECAFALVAQLQLENLATDGSAIAGDAKRVFWVWEAKLGQRKVREQAGASLGKLFEEYWVRPDILTLDLVGTWRGRRILDTATAGNTHIGGWSAQTEEHGRLHLRIGNRDGDVFGDRKPKLGHRWQEVIPGQQGIAVPILCTLKDLGEILDCEEETETTIWGTESVDFWRVQSQTYTLVTFPWIGLTTFIQENTQKNTLQRVKNAIFEVTPCSEIKLQVAKGQNISCLACERCGEILADHQRHQRAQDHSPVLPQDQSTSVIRQTSWP
ncbi:hypothetical protein B0H14DRAFT_3754091 [Mycena olivaceomarginata]|nr:hypothetical protein B0H14DRAFT_3754091 [Mycena olivaceomarginata]